MSKRTIATFTLFGSIVLGAVILLLIVQLNQSSQATEEREANMERIRVIAALDCDRGERLQAGKSPLVKKDLTEKGFVLISPACQRFVDLLDEDLIFAKDRVMLK